MWALSLLQIDGVVANLYNGCIMQLDLYCGHEMVVVVSYLMSFYRAGT